LRIGELLGLKWRALDLDIGTLAVRESVFEGQFQPPETQKAVRTIPLGPHAIAALRRIDSASVGGQLRTSGSGIGRAIPCGSPSC
jgi:integrase